MTLSRTKIAAALEPLKAISFMQHTRYGTFSAPKEALYREIQMHRQVNTENNRQPLQKQWPMLSHECCVLEAGFLFNYVNGMTQSSKIFGPSPCAVIVWPR